jgi:hypothetical protein
MIRTLNLRTPAARLAIGLLLTATAGCSVVNNAATWNSPRAKPIGAAGAGTTTGSAGAGPSASPSPLAPVYDVKPLLNPAKKYLGLEIPDAPVSMTPVQQFAGWVGKKPNLIGEYVGWNTSLDTQGVKNAWAYGALYFQVWEPFNITMKQIAAGDSDAYVTRFATQVRTLNLPIALSFGHEMNGDWYPWGTQTTSPADFVAAWRHIHDLFVKAGATNVIWIWDPNDMYPVPNVPLKPLYPGDAYIDWIGVTGYFTPTGPRTYSTLFLPTLEDIRTFSQKPFIIAETSVLVGANQVTSVNELTTAVKTHEDIIGFVWYDYDRQGDWRLETRPTVEAAFKTGVSSSLFGFDVSTAR